MNHHELGVKLVNYSFYVSLRLGLAFLTALLYFGLIRNEFSHPVILGLGAILLAMPLIGFIGVLIKVNRNSE